MKSQSKYPELQDKLWLEQKYIVEQLSCREISKIIGCHRGGVLAALKRHKIFVRSSRDGRVLVPKQSFKYDLLNDKEWLYQKYIIEGLSTPDIMVIVGGKTPNSARQALIRKGIKVRNQREGVIHGRIDDGFVLNEYTTQVIEGGLLGDAHFDIYNKESDICAPAFRRKNKFRDHVKFVRDEIGCIQEITLYHQKLNGKEFPAYQFETLTHGCLTPFYRRWWYPKSNDYVKLVPDDFVLTPISLLHWFLDDGYSCRRKRKTFQVFIGLCSESFTKNHNLFLVEQLRDKFNVKAVVIKHSAGTGWRIRVPQSQISRFYEVIGDCPVPSLAYKWKFCADSNLIPRKKSTIDEHVSLAEKIASENDGVLPGCAVLSKINNALYVATKRRPECFAHLIKK